MTLADYPGFLYSIYSFLLVQTSHISNVEAMIIPTQLYTEDIPPYPFLAHATLG
jgi:hypothetical protein